MAEVLQNVLHVSDGPMVKDTEHSHSSFRNSSITKRKASKKEKLHSQTEEIVKGHILGTARSRHYSAIYRYCSKVVEEHESTLSQLCKKLQSSRETLYSNFIKTFRNLFSGGITVGKIVTSIAFGGKMVEYCTENALDITDSLIAWTVDYFQYYLSDWILNYGGWVC